MAKLLGHDITTTKELEDFEKRLVVKFEERVKIAEDKIRSHKKYLVGAVLVSALIVGHEFLILFSWI